MARYTAQTLFNARTAANRATYFEDRRYVVRSVTKKGVPSKMAPTRHDVFRTFAEAQKAAEYREELNPGHQFVVTNPDGVPVER